MNFYSITMKDFTIQYYVDTTRLVPSRKGRINLTLKPPHIVRPTGTTIEHLSLLSLSSHLPFILGYPS